MKWALLLIFLVSRIIFLNPENVFFDSIEYLSRWSDNSFFRALTSGHPPLHAGYVAFGWPVYHLGQLLGIDPVVAVLCLQILVSGFTVYFFYLTVKYLFGPKLALRSGIFLALLPIYWVVNETVMMETLYLFFWILSLYCLIKFLHTPKNTNKWLVLSALSWTGAFLTHTVVIMWIPMYMYLVWMKSREKFLKFLMVGFVTLSLASFINAFLLSVNFQTSISQGFYWLYAAKFGEHAHFSLKWETLFRYLRNFIVPLGYNNTWVILLISIVGLFKLVKENKKYAILTALWIIPSFITNQWWDSLLYGRHSLITSFIIIILATKVLSQKSFIVISAFVSIISLSALVLLTRPIPYLSMAKELNNLPPGGLVIDTHFARPQTNGEYFGQMLFVDEPGWNIEKAKETIDGYLSLDKPVFVTGHALSEPYGLFCGPYLHNLSLSYSKPFVLSPFAKQYSFVNLSEQLSGENMEIYQIKVGESIYPSINNLSHNRRRLDWLDPLRVMVSLLVGY